MKWHPVDRETPVLPTERLFECECRRAFRKQGDHHLMRQAFLWKWIKLDVVI